MKLSEKINKIKESEICKLIVNDNIIGFRVKSYDYNTNQFNYYDFLSKQVASSQEIKDYINKNQSKFRSIKLKQINGVWLSKDEYDGKIQVQEFKDEMNAISVILPVIKIYKLKEVI